MLTKKKYIILKQKAFTMIEILMITIVVGVGLLSIIIAISKAKTDTQHTKQSVIATQLAQEGIEMVYQIRNTNLLKHSNYKNYCRLNENPEENCSELETPAQISTGNYILSGQKLISSSDILDISNGVNTGDLTFGLCLTGFQWIACPKGNNQTNYGQFFRTIEVKGLYLKDSILTGGELIDCINGNPTNCNNNTAKELRFCSRVEYVGIKTGDIEVCGILTNFFD